MNQITNIITLVGNTQLIAEVMEDIYASNGGQAYRLAPNKMKFITLEQIQLEAFQDLSKLYPTIKFKYEYADEDLGVGVGNFGLDGGNIVDVYNPKPLSNEAYTLAIDVTGDDFYIKEFLYTMKESEAKEEFPEMCMAIAYEKKLADNKFPKFILNQFLDLAVKEEEYEYASKLKKAIESGVSYKIKKYIC